MTKHRCLPLLSLLIGLVGFLVMTASSAGQSTKPATSFKTAKPSEQVERHLPSDQKLREWSLDENAPDDIKRLKVCRTEEVCKMRFKEGETPRMRIRNLVLPLRYEDENISISEAFTRQVRQALDNLQDKRGVTARFIGYTDNAPLTGGEQQTYGDQLSLSKAMAHRVAMAMQEKLGLPASAIESDGRGAARPVADNESVQGRALNRRVEVEFWYDDPLQELSEEPQLCPRDPSEIVTRVYEPLWGSIAPIALENGQPIIPPGYAANLRRALMDISDRTNARLRFIGYTRSERLNRRTASVYGDDVGLSTARAMRAMESIMQDPMLSGAKAEHEGRGYVQSDDVVNAGFIEGQESFVRVQVVYDEALPLDNYEGIDIKHLTQELRPKSPYDLNVLHIAVDGKPIDDPNRSSSDIQRCTDVALDSAKIQFRFDNLESKPRLAVAAFPVALGVGSLEASPAASVVRFRMYNNYSSFIDRAEIRIFGPQQSLQDVPLEVIAVDEAGLAVWVPTEKIFAGPERELKYLLRAYDLKGHIDETEARPLLLYREQASGQTGKALMKDAASPRELLAAYGENNLARHQIPLGSGTVTVQGSGIPQDHTVWLAGRQVPIDPKGNFAAEQILPDGTHTIEVAVLDDAGNGTLYLRDLEFKRRDVFYVGVADFTVSQNGSTGPIDLFQGQNSQQPSDSSLDGRLAFYVNGKVSGRWRLTASTDTREGPVKDLFSNFLDKSPDSLFRRINPEYYYPTFGDDGLVTEMAPTLGKFYLKASHGENYGMWGNFNTSYMGNELAHVDRGLYGGNLHYGSDSTTRFGERRLSLDGFAAQPGTLASYEEFRGTGGSLYFLRHQDILTGSDRVRIEIRDKDSHIVVGVVNLQPNADYNIDYLQGRLLLTHPLSSTADDNMLVHSSGLSGNEAWLVARYEYTPGFTQLNALSSGGQGHFWLSNHIQLGLTANSNEEGDAQSNLGAADMTLRMSAKSFLKMQAGRSEGIISSTMQSNDGGFGFQSPGDLSTTDAKAGAYRADLSIGIGDIFKGRDGVFTFYKQDMDAGYSAPGQMTLKDTEQYGGTLKMPVTNRLSLAAKGDQRVETEGLQTRAVELDLAYKLTERLSVSTGVRNDLRNDHSPVVPLTQEQGERTDAVAQVMFVPGSTWRTYGFIQDTVKARGSRESNSRIGAGGSLRLTKRFRIDGEASDGDLGPGGKVGTTFLYTESTNLYLNYSLDNERAFNGTQGRQGNFISGVKTRLSDSSSVYAEQRYQNGAAAGLTRTAGINLVAKDRWNFGGSTEIGTLRDSLTGAATNRKAAGMSMGYGREKMQFSSGVEFRHDNADQFDLTQTRTTAWLFRNNFKAQLTPSWRMIGKLDHSISDSSLGAFYAGGYTEGVVAYAYRPVRNNRLNALAKYTYFYNVPTTDQVTIQNTAVEFIQKSHIAALDLSYDLTGSWSVGGKYAYRLGQASLDRTQLNFFANTAQLAVLRMDRRFGKNWDAMAEVRMLTLPDIQQRRRGALATIYRRLGSNLKVGVGYNFTDFSDDLTDLRYNHRGVFFNVIGIK